MTGTALAAASAALLATLAGCAHAPPPPPPASSPSPLLGAPLPAFRRPTLQGTPFDSAAATGRVVVVDFFAAYCAPCQRLLPALERLHRDRPEVAFVGVSLDADPETARRLAARHGLTFPVIHDASGALAGRFRVVELPAAFVVAGDGRVRWVDGPGQPADALARAVVASLNRTQESP